MRLIQFANNAVSRLAANITASDTSISITPGDGAKFPSLTTGKYFMATLIKSDGTAEIVKVTARSTDTLTVVRAAEAVANVQTAYTFSAGDRIELRMTAGGLGGELDLLYNAAYIGALNKSANYTLTEADISSLVRVDTSGGAVTITLPLISSLTQDFDTLVAKVSSDGNAVTMARSGTDTINGASSYTLTSQWQAVWFVADRSTNTWTLINTTNSGVNAVVDEGTIAAGASTITLSGDPGSKNNTLVIVGGQYQQKNSYSISSSGGIATITLGGSVSSSVGYSVCWNTPLPMGTPGDGTVSAVKLTDNAIADKTHAATAKTTPVDADEFAISDSAASFAFKKLTWASIKAAIFSAWGALIGAGTSKATPVDADAFAMMDSAASNATKILTWANVKATLKAYFDALYPGNYLGQTLFGSTGQTLTSAHFGQSVGFGVSGASTHTLMAANSGPVGKAVTLHNYGTGAATFNRSGTDTIVAQGQTGLSSITLQTGESITLVTNGSNTFVQSNGAQNGVGASPQSIAVNGSGITRAIGTTYTNTTGRPIVVMVQIGNASNVNVNFQINATNVLSLFGGPSANTQATVIVPPGATYGITSGAVLQSWSELR